MVKGELVSYMESDIQTLYDVFNRGLRVSSE